jgi:acyl-CoA reductase-like NAD-dependent aldehyde dehydrogenase
MSATIEVRSPYSGEVVGEAPRAGSAELERALTLAVAGRDAMRRLPLHARAAALREAAGAVERDVDELGRLITAEQGKTRAEAEAEAVRIPGILRLCAEEAARLGGELLPMDAAPASVGRLGYTRPYPAGIVAAITPFNYPAILVTHKIGPALAAGNAVVLKPATSTPLTALFLVERLAASSLPDGAIQCLVGSGAEIGAALCADERVRMVTFTGSHEAGEAIARTAGAKRLACELGSNAALVVLDDADLDLAARAIGHSGFTNAGQNCVSTQRVIVHRARRDELIDRVLAEVDAKAPGDPALATTTLGPVIDRREAERVVSWLGEAREQGGELLRGGGRDGGVVEPALVLEPPSSARVWRDELFGPAVAVRSVGSDDEALALANDSRYGLACTVLTRSLDRAMRFADELDVGMVGVNSPRGATWRSDFMPWGGVADSGFGREGVRYAVREMSVPRLVVLHPELAR